MEIGQAVRQIATKIKRSERLIPQKNKGQPGRARLRLAGLLRMRRLDWGRRVEPVVLFGGLWEKAGAY